MSNPNATYTPPGWRRGILLMVLLAVSTVVCLIAVLLPIVLADVPMVETAPYRYPVTGDPDIDGATLRAAVLFGALISGISAVIVLPIFVLLHRWLIRQPLRELHDTDGRFGRDFGLTFLFCACLWLPILAHTFLTTDIDPRRWIMAAPLAAFVLFTLLPLQVYAEELIFRGYLQRWLETRLNGSLRAAILQSALFALLHPGLMVPTFLLGFAATELTRQTRSLGAATALHLANNLAIYLIAFNPATDGKLLDGHVAVSPLPFGFMPGVAIVIACLLVLPYILVRLTGKAEREVGLSASGS